MASRNVIPVFPSLPPKRLLFAQFDQRHHSPSTSWCGPKLLFSQLFDFNENSEDLIQQEATSDESEEKKLEREAMNKEINELQGLKDSIFEQDFAKSVFDKVFGSDIETLASIDTMWKLRKRPDSLSYDKILETINTEKGDNADLQEYAKQCLAADQKCWTIAEAFSVLMIPFCGCNNELLLLPTVNKHNQAKSKSTTPYLLTRMTKTLLISSCLLPNCVPTSFISLQNPSLIINRLLETLSLLLPLPTQFVLADLCCKQSN